MTDLVSDMLTRIRNANRIERSVVDMPATRLRANIARVLKDEGFIIDYQVGELAIGEHGATELKPETEWSKPKLTLRVILKYGPDGEKVIRHIERASSPGRRLYYRCHQLRPVLDGLGISILSTSQGVISDRQARVRKLGGEVLCKVW